MRKSWYHLIETLNSYIRKKILGERKRKRYFMNESNTGEITTCNFSCLNYNNYCRMNALNLKCIYIFSSFLYNSSFKNFILDIT